MPHPLEKARQNLDYPLLVAVVSLCIAGIIFVFTSSAAHAWQTASGQSMSFLTNHLQRLFTGILALVFFYHLKYQYLQRFAKAALIAGVVALIAVLFLPQLHGTSAKRWLMLFGLSIQPAEIAKYALILYAARRLTEIEESSFPSERTQKFNALLVVSSIVLLLVILEPNLSMVLLTSASLFVMFFLFGLEWKKIALIAATGSVGVIAVALIKPYMMARVSAFAAGITDPLALSYHVRQSLIAVGQGGLFGLGLGQSTQKHFYLPEPYNDSIFSIIGEETGLLGSVLILFAFAVLAVRGWRIAMHATDRFSYFLAAGITTSLICSFVVNVGVNLALLPATGQPLPFVSYGGSSLVMSLAAIGILLNMAKQQNKSAPWQGVVRTPSFV
ncbi:MAG: cell division protein FtsW [Calditrichaeota bacterium]|nr:cell division protein FtsW [Calditrichota bacterium]MCB9391061.1 cell division protein FtsW [Calditrichota bacterium]